MSSHADSAPSPMTTKTWAESPFSLISSTQSKERTDIPPGHSCILVAREMAAIHNIILRALNTCYNHACHVKTGTPQAASFIVFNQCLDEALHFHHESEEQHFFPAIEKVTCVPGFMERNVEQHRVFEAAAEAIKDYVHSVKPEEYDGQKLKDLITAFGGVLREHLVDEIQTLLELKDYDSQSVWKSIDDTREKALATMDSHRILPMLLTCQDASFPIDGEPFMVNVPWFLPYLGKYWFSRRHSGTWQEFSPFDFWGRRKLL